MKSKMDENANNLTGLAKELCIWKNELACGECKLHERLFCRTKSKKYAILFGLPFMIAIIPTIVETLFFSNFNLILKIGFLGGWFAYSFFFLIIWESRMLCNHCPYYANDSQKTLKCPIDNGKLKTGTYNPGPTTTSEKVQFVVGVFILMGFPVPFLLIGGLWISLIFLIIGAILWIIVLQTKICTDCVNFACPLNRVEAPVRNEFLKKNHILKEAWEKEGNKID